MRCRKAAGRLNAYLDGELSPRQAAAVREHLEACPRCAAELGGLESLNRALATAEGMEPSAGLVRRVVQAAEARQAAGVTVRMPAWVRFRPVLARLAAALVLVAGLGLGAAMGGSLPRDGRYTAEGIQSAMLDFPVDALSAVPPGSVAEAYLDLMEQNEGEGS